MPRASAGRDPPAEGEKQAAHPEAEGEAEAIQQVAEAERFRQLTVAEGEAQAIQTVFSAIHAGKPDHELLAVKYLETLSRIANGKATKIFLPIEATGSWGPWRPSPMPSRRVRAPVGPDGVVAGLSLRRGLLQQRGLMAEPRSRPP